MLYALHKARKAGDIRAFYKRNIVRKRGPDPNRKWTEEDNAKLRELARQGSSAAQMVPIFGVTRNAVVGRCHRKHIKLHGDPLRMRRRTIAAAPNVLRSLDLTND